MLPNKAQLFSTLSFRETLLCSGVGFVFVVPNFLFLPMYDFASGDVLIKEFNYT